jgi:hypothetical protein
LQIRVIVAARSMLPVATVSVHACQQFAGPSLMIAATISLTLLKDQG